LRGEGQPCVPHVRTISLNSRAAWAGPWPLPKRLMGAKKFMWL